MNDMTYNVSSKQHSMETEKSKIVRLQYIHSPDLLLCSLSSIIEKMTGAVGFEDACNVTRDSLLLKASFLVEEGRQFYFGLERLTVILPSWFEIY